MKKTRLYHLLELLGKKERVRFEEFLHSPYFNKREDVLRLYDFLKQERKKKEANHSRQEVFAYVYPGREYTDRDSYLITSYLYKLLEDFLAYEDFGKDKALIKFYTAKVYRDMKLGDPFIKKIKESRSILLKGKLRNSDYLKRIYDLENEYYNYLSSTQRFGEVNLKTVTKTFDAYSTSEKLRHYCFLMSQQALMAQEYDLEQLEAIIQLVEQNPSYLELPPIAIYFNYNKAISKEGDEQYFQIFRETIEQYKDQFNAKELKDIYLAAINICIRKANEGKQYYVEEIFNLHKDGLEQDLLFENDELSPFVFKNIMSASIKLKRLDWLESFITKYQSKLNPSLRDSIVRYTTAALNFEQKKYKEAMHLLNGLESDDYLLILSGKTILLKIYYELKEYDALEALLESMRLYLHRKKEMGYHKKVYLNVIRLTKKLIALPDYDQQKKNQLRSKVIKMQPLSLQEWFLEQLED